jgi:hypothetical protein
VIVLLGVIIATVVLLLLQIFLQVGRNIACNAVNSDARRYTHHRRDCLAMHEHVDLFALEKSRVEIVDVNCGAGEGFD